MRVVGDGHGKKRRPVVEVGAHVVYRGQTWQVAALRGQQVFLVGEDGTEEALLVGRLFADPGFEVVGGRAPDAVPQWGLFETVPLAAQQRALVWLPHIREVETGRAHPAQVAPVPARHGRHTTLSGGRWRSGMRRRRRR